MALALLPPCRSVASLLSALTLPQTPVLFCFCFFDRPPKCARCARARCPAALQGRGSDSNSNPPGAGAPAPGSPSPSPSSAQQRAAREEQKTKAKSPQPAAHARPRRRQKARAAGHRGGGGGGGEMRASILDFGVDILYLAALLAWYYSPPAPSPNRQPPTGQGPGARGADTALPRRTRTGTPSLRIAVHRA
jgi:hypothetical protein